MDEREDRRLAAVRALHILDTEPEAVFDEAVLLASTLCGTPVSLVTILDEQRQWFKAKVGVEIAETPREHAFCAHAIQQTDVFVVADAHLDPRFRDNPLVTGEICLRFYAGMPLVTTDAHALGTLCVMDTRPRDLTPEQKAALKILARQVTTHIEQRMRMTALNQVLAEQATAEQEISGSNALFQAFMDNSPLVSYMKDGQGRLIYYNRPFAEQFQVSRTEWINKSDFDIWPAEFAALFRALDLSVLECGKLVVSEQTSPGLRGETHWRSYKFPFVNDAGARFLAGMSLDISVEKEAEAALKRSHDQLHAVNAQLRELTVTDALTGLGNRRGFDERLRQEFALAARYGFDFSLLLLDVDRFKDLNDTFGHEAGDEVLRQIAQLLAACGRHADLVCRYGGEEFAVLLPNTGPKQALLLGNRIRRKIENADWELRPVTISAGVSTNAPGVGSAVEMVRMADLALYQAKENGRNRVVSYRPVMEQAYPAAG
jgi:diguanylate cyclase (GGDEF)-like protein/PAS domain S-box-containing protein